MKEEGLDKTSVCALAGASCADSAHWQINIHAYAVTGAYPSRCGRALNGTADMIEEPLDRAISDTQAVLIQPVRRHAQELRTLAKSLVPPA